MVLSSIGQSKPIPSVRRSDAKVGDRKRGRQEGKRNAIESVGGRKRERKRVILSVNCDFPQRGIEGEPSKVEGEPEGKGVEVAKRRGRAKEEERGEARGG